MTKTASGVLAILPMRGGSERVPGKNLVDLAGRPLYAWILDTLHALDGVVAIVDTDDDDIEASVRRTHPDVRVLRRPTHLGRGETPMNAVLLNTLEQESAGDVILQVHATNPFVDAGSLQTAIDAVTPGGVTDSAFSVSRLQARLWTADLAPLNHDPNVLLRTQDLQPWLIENSSFYAFDREVFVETGNRIGRCPRAVELSPLESIDIDVMDDLDFARIVANGLQRLGGEL